MGYWCWEVTALSVTPTTAPKISPTAFTYRVIDAAGNSDTATVSITITPVNDNDPVAGTIRSPWLKAARPRRWIGGFASVLNNDTDTDLPNDALVGQHDAVSGPNFGTLILNSDGTFQYTHDGSENFSDSFVYELLDADGGVTDTATVSITITPVNDNDPGGR